MTIEGQLNITLTSNSTGIDVKIVSTRPTQTANIFIGKPITQTLQTLPLLYSVCGKAQATCAVNAVESALEIESDKQVISQREAIVTIECLREYCIQILMIWPKFIEQPIQTKALASIVQSLNELMQTFNLPLILKPNCQKISSITQKQKALWQQSSSLIKRTIFAQNLSWHPNNIESIVQWANKNKTIASSFITWLTKQSWHNTGQSNIDTLPKISDFELRKAMNINNGFIAQPQWHSQCFELSWFNNIKDHPIIKKLLTKQGNSLFTRALARLLEISYVIDKLDGFFIRSILLEKVDSSVQGLAHINTARGRLTHYLELNDGKVELLKILAPTEWNFHPQGVVSQSLQNLQESDNKTINLQSDILINMIDPCVGYQLIINKG